MIGGAFGFAGSAVSQLMSGERFSMRKALGSAANGAVVDAVRGALVGSGIGVVRQIICIYFLHIKCTRFWCSLEERSKLLHLFAQFIWDCFGAVLYKQFLPFFFFQRLEP